MAMASSLHLTHVRGLLHQLDQYGKGQYLLHLTHVRGLLQDSAARHQAPPLLHLTHVRGLLQYNWLVVALDMGCTLPMLGDCYAFIANTG